MHSRVYFPVFRAKPEFDRWRRRHAGLLSKIQCYEEALAPQGECDVFGFCAACGEDSVFRLDYAYAYAQNKFGVLLPNFRERFECVECGLNSRMRASLHVLSRHIFPNRAGLIYITEQTTSLYKAAKSIYPGLIGSEFLSDGTQPGQINHLKIRHEDLTKLSFPQNSLDCIASFDVLEHIPDYMRALSECRRCLREGGVLFLTAPFNLEYSRNMVRAILDKDGELRHLEPPEIHGDPMSESGVLCFQHFGWSLLDDMRALGFSDAYLLVVWSRRMRYMGGLSVLLVGVK